MFPSSTVLVLHPPFCHILEYFSLPSCIFDQFVSFLFQQSCMPFVEKGCKSSNLTERKRQFPQYFNLFSYRHLRFTSKTYLWNKAVVVLIFVASWSYLSAFNLLVIGHGVVVVFRVDVRGLGDILASVYYTIFRVLIFGLGEKKLVEYSKLWPCLMRWKSWLYGHVILGGLLALLELIAYLSKWVTAHFVGAI